MYIGGGNPVAKKPTVEVSISDARKHLSELVQRVAYQGISVTITRNGKPVCELNPPAGAEGVSPDFLKLVDGVIADRKGTIKALE